MDKKPLRPFLKERYAKLATQEAALREKLERLYVAHSAEVTELLTALQPPTGHAALRARMTQSEHERIRGDKHRSLLDFDQINKLDYVLARMLLLEYDLAEREYKLIYDHLLNNVVDCYSGLGFYLSVSLTQGSIVDTAKKIINGGRNDIKRTLYTNAEQRAKLAVTAWERGIIRGEDPAANAEKVSYDNLKNERRSSDRIVYTEGTRTTNDSVIECIKDDVKYVRSVTVKDGKACGVCRDIEREQLDNPVMVDDAQAGVNIPPFHQYCRCYVEAVYDED